MVEPSNAELRADIALGFRHDERIRAVEQAQAAHDAKLDSMRDEVRAMRIDAGEDKKELLTAISENKSEMVSAIRASKVNPWPIVAAITAIVAVVLTIAAAIYGGAA